MRLTNEARVGILITIGIAALLWGLNYLKGTDLFITRNKFYAIYSDVDGLVSSNPILLNGLKIGQVEKLMYHPDHSGRIIATFIINSSVFIPKSSIAYINSSDILGTKAITLEYGIDKTPAHSGDTLASGIKGSIAQQVGPLKDKAESLIESLDSVAHGLHLLLNPDSRSSLASMIKNFEHASESLDYLVSSDNSKLRIMLNNAESIASNLKNNSEKLSNIINNFSQLSDSLVKANLAQTISNADKTLNETYQIMNKINKGQGSLGLLVNNDSLYNRLSSTAADIDKLVIDLKANPKRYVHFSVFGKSEKQK